MRPLSGLGFFVAAALVSGAGALDAPSINVRIAEPEGSAATRAVTGAARSAGRFLRAAEDRVRENDVMLARAMSSATAQISEVTDAVEALFQVREHRA